MRSLLVCSARRATLFCGATSIASSCLLPIFIFDRGYNLAYDMPRSPKSLIMTISYSIALTDMCQYARHAHIIRQVIASVENGKWVAGKNSQLTWHRKTTWHGAPNTRAESARVLCARACLPAPRGLALPVREPVPTDYSRTSCCCSSSRLTIEYDGVRGCARW